jgi:hypothetical protein
MKKVAAAGSVTASPYRVVSNHRRTAKSDGNLTAPVGVAPSEKAQTQSGRRTEPRYWVGVASREHVLNGIGGGFAQFGHGKLAPARRLWKGDWVACYSGKMVFGQSNPCGRFTAVGYVADDGPYQVEQAPGFKPWRRRVSYARGIEAGVLPLIPHLGFIKSKSSWGTPFRFGFFEVPRSDFERIARAMRVLLGIGRDPT